jgi:sugar (pentulose or hexulose) kinase
MYHPRQESSNPKLVLAIDLGKSGAKVGVVDLNGQVLACAGGSYEPYYLSGGGVEQDPQEWWSVIVCAARNALGQVGLAPEMIEAVGVTSQWSVTVPLDANGEPLMNAISWMDSRGSVYNKKLVGGFPSLQGYQDLDQIAGAVLPGSQGVLFMPYFMGSLAPCEEPMMQGGFLNLSNTTTRMHLTQALLEGIAYNWRWKIFQGR